MKRKTMTPEEAIQQTLRNAIVAPLRKEIERNINLTKSTNGDLEKLKKGVRNVEEDINRKLSKSHFDKEIAYLLSKESFGEVMQALFEDLGEQFVEIKTQIKNQEQATQNAYHKLFSLSQFVETELNTHLIEKITKQFESTITKENSSLKKQLQQIQKEDTVLKKELEETKVALVEIQNDTKIISSINHLQKQQEQLSTHQFKLAKTLENIQESNISSQNLSNTINVNLENKIAEFRGEHLTSHQELVEIKTTNQQIFNNFDEKLHDFEQEQQKLKPLFTEQQQTILERLQDLENKHHLQQSNITSLIPKIDTVTELSTQQTNHLDKKVFLLYILVFMVLILQIFVILQQNSILPLIP